MEVWNIVNEDYKKLVIFDACCHYEVNSISWGFERHHGVHILNYISLCNIPIYLIYQNVQIRCRQRSILSAVFIVRRVCIG
jgi:hypothetical protein